MMRHTKLRRISPDAVLNFAVANAIGIIIGTAVLGWTLVVMLDHLTR